MSTVAEIEAAVEALSREQQEELFTLLAERIGRPIPAPVGEQDPFASMIGAYAGPHEATGRQAEEILYGNGRGAPLRFWTPERFTRWQIATMWIIPPSVLLV
jgi:hypothetical protein